MALCEFDFLEVDGHSVGKGHILFVALLGLTVSGQSAGACWRASVCR